MWPYSEVTLARPAGPLSGALLPRQRPADAPETPPGLDGPLPSNPHAGRPGAAGRPSDHHPAGASRPMSVIVSQTTLIGRRPARISRCSAVASRFRGLPSRLWPWAPISVGFLPSK
jgi:hypothetical protein